MINAARDSTKRRDDRKSIVLELVVSGSMSQAVQLTLFDTETHRPSIFFILHQAYKVRKAFQVTAKRTDNLNKHYQLIFHGQTLKIMDFLAIFSAATKAQSGRIYVILSYTSHLLSRPKAKRKTEINVRNSSGCMFRKPQYCTFGTKASVMF